MTLQTHHKFISFKFLINYGKVNKLNFCYCLSIKVSLCIEKINKSSVTWRVFRLLCLFVLISHSQTILFKQFYPFKQLNDSFYYKLSCKLRNTSLILSTDVLVKFTLKHVSTLLKKYKFLTTFKLDSYWKPK